jgi:hypothetical protein
MSGGISVAYDFVQNRSVMAGITPRIAMRQ